MYEGTFLMEKTAALDHGSWASFSENEDETAKDFFSKII